jgi:hypothetical protein
MSSNPFLTSQKGWLQQSGTKSGVTAHLSEAQAGGEGGLVGMQCDDPELRKSFSGEDPA